MKKPIIILTVVFILACSSSKILTEKGDKPDYHKATIATGPYHAMVIKDDGTLITWGDGFYGILGTDEGYEQFPSDDSKVMDNVCWVSGSQFGSYAVDTAGTLWSWGHTALGRDGEREIPLPVLEDVVMVSTSGFHTLALKNDGSVWGWGQYTFGELGRGMGNTPQVNEHEVFYQPVYEEKPVLIIEDAKYIAASGASSYVIKNDNTLWGFGAIYMERFEDGTRKCQTIPVQIMENVRYVDGSYVIQTDDSLWTMGREDNVEGLNFVKMMENVKYATGAAGGQQLVVKNDGSLWTWGRNHLGILGDGTTKDRWEPQMVIDSGVVYATGSTFLTLALKEDGSLWHMGSYSDIGTDNTVMLPHQFMDGVMLP